MCAAYGCSSSSQTGFEGQVVVVVRVKGPSVGVVG